MKVAAEMQLPKFVVRTHGLRMSEMRIKVLEPLEQVDKFFMLGLIDEMVEELSRGGTKAMGPVGQNIRKKTAMVLLKDLRQWFILHYCYDVVECCARMSELQRRLAAQEAECAALKARLNDGWTDRVTYENMVEKIAANEDASERDYARNLIEPMLKRDMVRRFREDIKAKVKELNGEEDGKGGTTFNNYGTYNEINAK
jgi:hypothetical protein